VSELEKLRKENKLLRALLKHSSGLLERSTELLNARSTAAPSRKRTARKKAAKPK
jgi:hypothetical protein